MFSNLSKHFFLHACSLDCLPCDRWFRWLLRKLARLMSQRSIKRSKFILTLCWELCTALLGNLLSFTSLYAQAYSAIRAYLDETPFCISPWFYWFLNIAVHANYLLLLQVPCTCWSHRWPIYLCGEKEDQVEPREGYLCLCEEHFATHWYTLNKSCCWLTIAHIPSTR